MVMVKETQRRCRVRGESRRAEILDAALRVFLKCGYRGATMDLVVAEANASKATIYSYFGGKDGLFMAIVEERTEQVVSDLFADDNAEPREAGNVDVHLVLAQIARRLLASSLEPDTLALYRLILSEGIHFPEVARTFFRIGPDRGTARLAGILARWHDQGLISVDDPFRLAHQFLIIALGDLHVRGLAGVFPEDLNAAIDDNVHAAVRFFRKTVGWTSPPA